MTIQAGSIQDFLVRPAPLPPDASGLLMSFTPEQAGWDTTGFLVRRAIRGEVLSGSTGDNEVAIVVLKGRMTIDWGEGVRTLGERDDVFAGYPFCVYLPCATPFELHADTLVEFAEASIHSKCALNPRLYKPSDLGCEIRGSGNTTRQVVRIIRPEHPADKLMVNEVYTPGGNWSSYPPHRHEIDDPPKEADLDEIYYFRLDHPDGFALLRVYDSSGEHDMTVTVRDGDLALLRDGYHLVGAPPGYNLYYLAVLAGRRRSLAASIDPRYAHLRDLPGPPDPRVPLVHPKPVKSAV
jgi:5-deoxy-glucuronate isomerase